MIRQDANEFAYYEISLALLQNKISILRFFSTLLTVQLHGTNSEYKTVVFYIYDEAEQSVLHKTVSAREALQLVVFEGIETGCYAIYIHRNKDDDPAFFDISINRTQNTTVGINLITYG